MNSRGFLRGERNLTLKRVCIPPPSPPPPTAMRKTRHKCAATAERVSRDSWLCEGSSGIPPPLPPHPSLPTFPWQHWAHHTSHTSSCVITRTLEAGWDLSSRYFYLCERVCMVSARQINLLQRVLSCGLKRCLVTREHRRWSKRGKFLPQDHWEHKIQTRVLFWLSDNASKSLSQLFKRNTRCTFYKMFLSSKTSQMLNRFSHFS